MPKAAKSSASAGTRKKHAKKAAKGEGDEEDQSQQQSRKGKGDKKLSKAQKRALPKVKQYIPPPKAPAPPIPDPLDGQGLARTLPAELVVVLRRLGKKDDVTRRKGLEELRESYVAELLQPSSEDDLEKELKETALLDAVPVWLHNLASLLQSPFHRTLAIQLHGEMLSLPSLRASIVNYLSLGLLPGTQNRDVLGSWLVAALEEGRRAGGSALRSWEECTTWSLENGHQSTSSASIDLNSQITSLIEYLSLSILDPPSLHDDIHPLPVQSTPAATPPQKNTKGPKAKNPVLAPALVVPVEDQSVLDERMARYRVGGLTGLSWIVQQLPKHGYGFPPPELLQLLSNRALWSSLSSLQNDSAPDFGYGQPTVRRAAYSLLDALVEAYPDTVGQSEMLELLSVAILECCWRETEATVWTAGASIAKFLSRYSQAWDIAMHAQDGEPSAGKSPRNPDEDETPDDDQDGDGSDEDDTTDPEDQLAEEPSADSQAFVDFLEFIATTCPTIPHLAYPLLLVIISSLPDSILPLEPEPTPSLQTLFAHMWSPVDARLLATHAVPGQPSAFQAFLQDAVDCTIFLVGKALRKERGRATARWLVLQQLGDRVWKEGVMTLGGRAKRRGEVARETEAELFGKAVSRLASTSHDLAEELLSVVSPTMLDMCFGEAGATEETNTCLKRSLPILSAMRSTMTDMALLEQLELMVQSIGKECAKGLNGSLIGNAEQSAIFAESVVKVLQREEKSDPQLLQTVVSLIKTQPVEFFLAVPSFTAVEIVKLVDDQSSTSHLWAFIGSLDQSQVHRFTLASAAIAAGPSLLPDGSLDQVALEAVSVAQASIDTGSIAQSALQYGPPALSKTGLKNVLDSVSRAIIAAVDDLMMGRAKSLPSSQLLDILAAAPPRSDDHPADLLVHLALYRLSHIVPRILVESPASTRIATDILEKIPKSQQSLLVQSVLKDLAALVVMPACVAKPRDLVDVALLCWLGQGTSGSSLASSLIPTDIELSTWSDRVSSEMPPPSLAILDALIPYRSEESPASALDEEYDVRGFSKAARAAEAILALLRADRSVPSSRPAVLQFVLECAILAQDELDIPGIGSTRGLFGPSVDRSDLFNFVREADGALSFALADMSDAPLAWHLEAISRVKGDQSTDQPDFLQTILGNLAKDMRDGQSDVAARVFRDVLVRHFRQSGAGEKEALEWLTFLISVPDRTPQLALPILVAIKPILLDSKPFETAQNRLASSLSSIPARSANAIGIPALRLLIASAPPEDAASVFLPQQRAIFVLRHVQKWLTSDEADEMGDEIEYYLAQLYTAVAPIVQDVGGDHWDNIFDLVESGLDASSLGEPTTYPLLYQLLLLLKQIRDLCGSNKALRASWTGKDAQLKLVLKLFLECRDADSNPVQRIQELLLDLIGDMPEKALQEANLPALCDLLRLSSSSPMQCTAYRILSRVIRANTVALVFEVEASVSEAEQGHASRTIALPKELVDIASTGAGVDWHVEEPIHLVLGQLLAWMGILDHFDDASRTLRWAYLDQLNSSQLIQTSLVPLLFGILGVSEVGAWNFPAGQYAVDEFYPDLLDPEDLPDLSPLASHLFYRSLVTLPSVMRSYFESLKDRQLSMSMLSFVARYYSPVIISHEFSALREPSALATLTEEGLNVKIAQGGGATVAAGTGSAEAIASYVVDEQPMEIGIRLPAEFPLKGVEIRDLRRVGVPENKWRGWLMSVQQTITSRNGLILEALTVFKKNVSLHFEGVVECAICYSIISLTDRTLPTKPCRTCKNRFHASCLFKWFNSSHSSSCPMCRSLF